MSLIIGIPFCTDVGLVLNFTRFCPRFKIDHHQLVDVRARVIIKLMQVVMRFAELYALWPLLC